jgi:hypothetical protein
MVRKQGVLGTTNKSSISSMNILKNKGPKADP